EGGGARALAEGALPALRGQPEGRLLRVVGRAELPLQSLLQGRRPPLEDTLLSGTRSEVWLQWFVLVDSRRSPARFSCCRSSARLRPSPVAGRRCPGRPCSAT